MAVLADMEIYLIGAIDIEQEKAKLEKQKEKILKDLKRSEGKLNNEGFVSKAPEDVINKEKAKVAEMQGQIDLIDKSLAELS